MTEEMKQAAEAGKWGELKRLALAAEQAWSELCGYGGDALAEAWDAAESAYAHAADPDVILELIAENERLRLERGDPIGSFDKHMQYMQENIQLKAENEALRQAASVPLMVKLPASVETDVDGFWLVRLMDVKRAITEAGGKAGES